MELKKHSIQSNKKGPKKRGNPGNPRRRPILLGRGDCSKKKNLAGGGGEQEKERRRSISVGPASCDRVLGLGKHHFRANKSDRWSLSEAKRRGKME